MLIFIGIALILAVGNGVAIPPPEDVTARGAQTGTVDASSLAPTAGTRVERERVVDPAASTASDELAETLDAISPPEPEVLASPSITLTSQPDVTDTPSPELTPATAPRGPPAPDGILTIYHFDVGQADATLIQSPDATILIDAGDWQRDDVVPYLHSVGVESLDLLIVTHPHADHIGQVPQVMSAFPVDEVWMSGWQATTTVFERALDAILRSEAGYHEPRAGETEVFGALVVEVIHPVDPLQDVHDNLAIRIAYGEFVAIYTGDAEADHEREMVSRGHDLAATVLQLGHHGSSTSTSPEFLNATDPEVAIYSAGADNDYGHPDAEVVDRVTSRGIDLYGTDVHGTIVVTTDGDSYRVEVEYQGDVRPGTPDPEPEPTPEPGAAEPDIPAPGCVDINTASSDELQRIIHIGPGRAQQILDLRPFASVDALTRIDGISEGRLNDIKKEGRACVQ